MTTEQHPQTTAIPFTCGYCKQEQHAFRFKDRYHLHDDTCGYTLMFGSAGLAKPEKLQAVATQIRTGEQKWTCPNCGNTYDLELVPGPQGGGRYRLTDAQCELVLMCEHDSPAHEPTDESGEH